MVCERSIETLSTPPNSKQLEVIKNELNEECDEKLEHNLRLLNEWIKCQTHFPKNIEMDFVKGFLRGCKHNLDKSKRKLEYHFTARNLYPEVYSNRSPFSRELTNIMLAVNIVFLPKLDQYGNRLWILKVENPDINLFSLASGTKLFLMIYDLLMTLQNPVCGEIAIYDGSKFTGGHFAKFVCSFARTLTVLLREAYAIRQKRVHVINAPPMLEKMLAVFKPLLHKNVRNTFTIHKNIEEFRDYFGPDLLPSDYGGNLKSVREIANDIYDTLKDNAEWYQKMENVKITGPPPKKMENILYFNGQLGLEGSFRKLEID